MTPSATAVTRGLTTVALIGAVLIPGLGLLATSSYADDAVSPASATPTVDIGEPAYEVVPATDDFPSTGGWIIGGTLQEGSQAAAPPAAAAPVKPVTVTAPAAPAARPVTVVPATHPAARAVEATVLPFTGPGRLSVQVTLGAGLVLLGVVLTSANRPKGTLRHAR